ncbi:MAG: peptidoglycan DD-metalloendopeptidase family protein, partial [bacterium]
NNNGDEKFYFFRVDKDKIKLHLKEIGSKFISKKRRRKKIALVISIFVLIGIGIALYTNSGNDNLENYDLGSEEDIIEESETGEEESTETEDTMFFGEDDLELEEEEKDKETAEDNTTETIRDSNSVVVEDSVEETSSPGTDESSESESSETRSETGTESSSEEKSTEEDTDQSQNEREEEEGVVTESTSPARETVDTSEKSFLKPVSGEVIQENGWFYHQIFEDWRFQNGITLEGESGDVVMAADSGTVASVKEDEYRGIMVEIDHGNGWSSYYGHLRRASVSSDEVVGKGQEVGLIGESGITDEPCLYFELINEDGPVDPLEYFE